MMRWNTRWERGMDRGNDRPVGRVVRRARIGLVVAAIGLGGAACGSRPAGDPFGGTGAGEPARPRPNATITRMNVSVQNRTGATVQVVGVGGRRREGLGSVPPHEGRTLTMRWTRSGAATFEISLGDGFVCVTRPVTVEPGGEVAVAVAPDPSRGDPVGGSGASCTAHVAG